jgi:hypothetical protein
MPDSPGIGEQALNKAAEIGLSSQLDEVEKLDVEIQTDPLKLIQGQVEAVTIEGEGLVMQKDLRVEELEMEMGSVAINPIGAALGKIELTKPTKASTRVILTEDDINRAFNSEYVRTQLQNQRIDINGQSSTIIAQNIEFHLLIDGKISLKAKVLLKETNQLEEVGFSAVPIISDNGQTVSLEKVEFINNKEISPELTKALVEQTSEILNLSNFDLEGMTLKIQHLEVQQGKLTLQAEAYVEQIPTS